MFWILGIVFGGKCIWLVWDFILSEYLFLILGIFRDFLDSCHSFDSWELKYIKILHNIFLSILRTGFQISDICGDFVNQVSGSMYVSVCLTRSFCVTVHVLLVL